MYAEVTSQVFWPIVKVVNALDKQVHYERGTF